MNKDIQEGGWKVLKGRMQAEWGKLTDQDLEQLKGNMKALAGKLQVYYGKAKQNVQQEIDAFKERLKKDDAGYEDYFAEK